MLPKKLYVMDPDFQRFVDAGLEYGAAMGVFAVAAVGAVQQPLLPPHPHLGLPHGNLYCMLVLPDSYFFSANIEFLGQKLFRWS